MKIKKYCKEYDIVNYTINNDGSIDVDGDVVLEHIYNDFPIKFRRVSGNFDIYMPHIDDLSFCPEYVGGRFSVRNSIRSESTDDIYYHSKKYIRHCEHQGYDVSYMEYKTTPPKLISLKGGPQYVGGDYIVCCTEIQSLEGAPECVGRFHCDDNEIYSLKYAPKCKILECRNNNLTTIDYEYSLDILNCEHNKIKRIDGITAKCIYCRGNRIDYIGVNDIKEFHCGQLKKYKDLIKRNKGEYNDYIFDITTHNRDLMIEEMLLH